MITIVVLLLVSTHAFGLECYDCDPSDEGQCIDPAKHNIKLTDCQTQPSNSGVRKLVPQPKITINQESVVYDCMSLYFEALTGSTHASGVYRGCVVRINSSQTTCEYLTTDSRFNEELRGKVTKCWSCKEDGCNKGAPDGAASLTISLVFVVILSSLSLYI